MNEPTKKPNRGRPSRGKTTIKYTVSLPNRVADLAERAKSEMGLSALITECLEQRYGAEHQAQKQNS